MFVCGGEIWKKTTCYLLRNCVAVWVLNLQCRTETTPLASTDTYNGL